jgi:hypothetical protein
MNKHEELIELFKAECHDRATEIDPDSEEVWSSLTLGWAIAKGLSPEEARDFAIHIRYHTELG